MIRQPLHRLQKLPNGSGEPFLYDDSWMHDAVSRRTLAQHGNEIVLFDGVASGLARLSGLLRPALELLWVEDVRRMNRWLGENVPDVAGSTRPIPRPTRGNADVGRAAEVGAPRPELSGGMAALPRLSAIPRHGASTVDE